MCSISEGIYSPSYRVNKCNCIYLLVASNVRLIRTFMIMQNKRLIIIVLTSAILLLIPLIGMQFTDEVNWTLGDFVIAGALLFGTGLMCELVIRKVKKINYRIAICVALLVLFLLVWAELAVGIFGTPFSGQ